MVNSAIGCFPSCWASVDAVGLLGGEEVLPQLVEPVPRRAVHHEVADLDDHAADESRVDGHLQVDRVAGQTGQRVGEGPAVGIVDAIMNARRELIAEFPLLAQMGAPSTDKDAFIPIHPGAAAYYGDTQQSFFDKYSNQLYYGPMAIGAIMSGLVAAWKFLGLGGRVPAGTPLDSLYALARRIRGSKSEAELAEVEDEIDNILKSELAKTAKGDETATDPGILSLAAHRLEYLIHYRRTMLAATSH